MTLDWSEILEFVRSNQDFLVTSHVHPDGDAVGSSIAMARILHGLGKRAQVILADPPAPMYGSFHAPGEIQVFDTESTDLSGYRSLIVVDVSAWNRLGALGDSLQGKELPSACIDHHPASESFCDFEVRDTEASATAVMIHDLARALGVEINLPTAEAIYMGVMVDTQSFRLPNTNADAHDVAAACLRLGVAPAKIYEPVFGTYSKQRMGLMAAALPTLTVHAKGRVATILTTQALYDSSGANSDDDEGLVEYPRSIEGVEVAIFLRERRDGTVKVSWRSRDELDIRESAVYFGGGGHVRAAGAVIPGKIDRVLLAVVDEVANRLFRSRD